MDSLTRNMKFNNYQKWTRETWKGTDDRNSQLLHATLGICGEISELDIAMQDYISFSSSKNKQKVILELGDILYYITRAIDLFDWNLYTMFLETLEQEYIEDSSTVPETIQNMYTNISWLAEDMKKLVFYNADNNKDNIYNYLKLLIFGLDYFSNKHLQTSLEEISIQNQEKLNNRYPDGFDNAQTGRN